MTFTIKKSFHWLISQFYRSAAGVSSSQCLCRRARYVLDELNCANRIDKNENILYGDLETADAACQLKTVVYFPNELIRITCLDPDRQLPGNKLSEALQFCNKWNSREYFPMAFIDPYSSHFITEYSTSVDACTSNRFLKERVIGPVLIKSLEFFRESGTLFSDNAITEL